MKIVVNRCYGGFGLSTEAICMYAERKGFKIYAYTQTKYKFKEGVEEYKRLDDKGNKKKGIRCYLKRCYLKKDLGETISKLQSDNSLWFSEYDIARDDKDLITVVEKLGKKANGDHAELEVVKIPDNIKWEISEYDGVETIEEEHKRW